MKRTILATAILFAFVPAVAVAQSPEIAQWQIYIRASCKSELNKFCKGVPAGQGQVLACLYSREKALSPKCGAAVMASLERLSAALDALANARRVCEADVKRLCNGVIAGDGNLIGCLAKSRASVSPACNTTLDTALFRP